MLSRWQKLNIVHGFLNTMDDDTRLNWHHTIESTYQDIKDGVHGEVTFDGSNYSVYMKDGHVYSWSEH